jgi:glycosyltransferase involved in cell wall biosynthesis
MKIAFLSAVAFGAQGTSGTYRFIEECSKQYNVIVLAPPPSKKTTVFTSNSIRYIPVKSLSVKEKVLKYVGEFDPDIVYVFNSAKWFEVVNVLKEVFPKIKYVLDIKSPLLAEGEKREDIQINGNRTFEKIDSFVTVSETNIKTWIPHCDKKPLVYPLGLDSSIFKKASLNGVSRCRKFVYIGVLHAQRQLDVLIDSFLEFYLNTDKNVSLDFYGTGPEEDVLKEIVELSPNGHCIRFNGLYPQMEMIERLSTYDAGIAWVPNLLYDSSPSLKSIEYMGVGLPILASKTKAHETLSYDGCSIDFFENEPNSLANALTNMYENGFSRERVVENFQVVKKFSYEKILENYFTPLFENLVSHTSDELDQENCSSSQKKILFVGPLGFRQGVWETRANYIFPDLFDAVPPNHRIYMITQRVPDFAKVSLKSLCNKFGITHYESRPKSKGLNSYDYWLSEITYFSNVIGPDVITNIFAPATLGLPMGIVGNKIGAKVVLRVAGDEIGSRIPMGIYDNNLNQLETDLAFQSLAHQMADKIIVMSPLEKQRVCRDLPESERNKVVVCIRGVDIQRFSNNSNNSALNSVKKFLFLGRKSLEKGYDILEKVADITQEDNVEFVFAGSFEPKKNRNKNYIGWVDYNNLQSTFSEADVFIMTSRTEGFPQVAAEAMAMGMPCILPSHLFGNIFKDRHEALLVSLNPEEISQKIYQLTKDDKLANSLSKNARKFAKNKLDKKKWSRTYHDIILGKENIITPFDNSKKLTHDNENYFLPASKQIKMAIVCSSESCSNRQSFARLNRFIIEMVRRQHLVYFFYPTQFDSFVNLRTNVVSIPYFSIGDVKQQVSNIDPNVLVVTFGNFKDEAIVDYALGSDYPVVVLDYLHRDEENNSVDIEFEIWRSELFLRKAHLYISVNNNKLSCKSHKIAYPQVSLEDCSDENLLAQQECLGSMALTVAAIDSIIRKNYDRIERMICEMFVTESSLKSIEYDEVALHRRRMVKRLFDQQCEI